MARYKVGDRVVVRGDLVLNKAYWMLNDDGSRGEYRDTFVAAMSDFAGCVVTIRSVYGKYHIKEETCCNWTDEMFAGLEEEVLGGDYDISADDLDAILR